MKILFNEMEDTVLEHFQGGEGRFVPKMFNDGTNKIMRGRLEPGCSVGMHTHIGTSEIVFVLSGEGKMYLGDGGVETLLPGDCFRRLLRLLGEASFEIYLLRHYI